MNPEDYRVDLDKVLAKARWLNDQLAEVRANSTAVVSALVAPRDQLGRGGFGYGATLLGLPVYELGDQWGLVLTFPEKEDES